MEQSRGNAKRTSDSLSHGEIKLPSSKFGEHSYIVSGKEAQDIHKQNVAQLEKLSVQEMEEERLRLMSQLSSSTIKFLQSRRKSNQQIVSKSETLKPGLKIDNDASLLVKTERDSGSALPSEKDPSAGQKGALGRKKVFSNSLTSPQSPSQPKEPEPNLLATLPINPDEAKQWLHMNVVEKEKLEWMKDLPPARKAPGPDEPYAARFDFQGMIICLQTF